MQFDLLLRKIAGQKLPPFEDKDKLGEEWAINKSYAQS